MIFSLIGLVADIIGALLLFKYGLPSKQISEEGETLTAGVEDDELEKIKKHNRRIYYGAHIGLLLLILGFIGQFIGTLTQCS